MPASPSRRVRLLVAVVIAVLGMGAVQTGVAQADPKCPKPGNGNGNGNGNGGGNGNPYPPGQCQGTAQPDRVVAGQDTFVQGRDFSPGELVRFELHSVTTVLGTFRATREAQTVRTPTGGTMLVPAGWVGHSVTIPLSTPPGAHVISLEGLSSGNYLTVDVTILPPGLPHTDPGSGSGGGGSGLPFTGLQLLTLGGAGVATIVVGAMLVAAARRRRRAVALS